VSVTTDTLDDDSPVHPGEHHTHGPSDRQYFTIFWVLVAITVLEVSTYFWETEANKWFAYALLLVLMVIKFVLIASFFMHLRFDSRLLTRTFYFGLAIALAVYTVALSVMNIWTDNGMPWYNDPPPAVTTTTVAEGGTAAGG
jgi:cytochrome c oxidase subunit 4